MIEPVFIIPARGGSKRIPKKNIRPFQGIPALAVVINTIRAAHENPRIIVSTDDSEICDVALDNNAEIHQRRSELSDDHTGLTPVVQNIIEDKRISYETPVFCFLATALLIRPETVQKAYNLFLENQSEGFVLPILEFSFPPQRGLVMENNTLKPWQEENILKRSQDLQKIWHDSGQFYLATVKDWMDTENPFFSTCRGVPVDFLEAQDIDTESDWKRAEIIASLR